MNKFASVKEISRVENHLETGLGDRISAAERMFTELYGEPPTLCVRSPGRAEIIGNHTDYNNGYALAAAISRSIIALYRPRDDDTVTIASDSFGSAKISFSLSRLEVDEKNLWINYVKAVLTELIENGVNLTGADVLLNSNLPSSGGVSSSAALELAIAAGFLSLSHAEISPLDLAVLCRRAENGPFVKTPCGLLDQASIALGQKQALVLIDFLPTKEAPASTQIIEATKALEGYSFVIAVDKQVKRNLGETGYPARRKMCEESLPLLSKLLHKEVNSLRHVSVSDFQMVKDDLAKSAGKTLTSRVEHIVMENQRVLDSVSAIKSGDVAWFGTLLNESGVSALSLYGLDEKTPELTKLVQIQRDQSNVIGIRNMGGGFSAITLALVKSADVSTFCRDVSSLYQSEYGKVLDFIDFVATDGVAIL